MFVRELILVCYLLCIIMEVSGLTMALLIRKKNHTESNKAFMMFLIGLFIMCGYDMIIYYCDYVIGGLNNLKILRIGNCIIACTMFLWVNLQMNIIKKDSLQLIDTLTKRYLMFYASMWLLLTCFLSIEQFYTLKWLLLTTDVALIILILAASVGHIIFASMDNDKPTLYYMLVVTAMLLWNYVSYFWGETSVYWGNSEFIREPLDLTIVFWLIASGASLFYCYKFKFLSVYKEEESHAQREGIVDVASRIEDICRQYRITPREKEFIELIYKGKSNKEIAELLFLSESTVKTHIYNIFRKLDVKNRVGVICVINGEQNIEKNDDDKKGV